MNTVLGYDGWEWPGVTTYKSTPSGQIRLIGTEGWYLELRQFDHDWFDVAKKVFPYEAGDGKNKLQRVWVKWENIKDAVYKRSVSPAFSPCTFDATNSFMAKWLGMSLDLNDKEWLARHQFAETGGIQAPYTPTCIQQLIEPYGLAIKRIRLPIGSLVENPELRRWTQPLGINPWALTDGRTTNEEGAKRVELSVEEAHRRWAFDFGTECLYPSIVGRKFNSAAVAGFSSSSGHAEYVGPRGNIQDWSISIQIAPAQSVQYQAKLELPEYKDRGLEEEYDITLDKVVDDKGLRIGELINSRWVKFNPNRPKTEVPFYARAGGGAGGNVVRGDAWEG